MIYPWGDSNARTQLRRLVLCPAELQGHPFIMITPYEEIDKKLSLGSVRPEPRRTRQVMNVADIMNQLQYTTGGETYPRQLSLSFSASVPAGEVRTGEQAIDSACRLALRTQEALDGAFVGA